MDELTVLLIQSSTPELLTSLNGLLAKADAECDLAVQDLLRHLTEKRRVARRDVRGAVERLVGVHKFLFYAERIVTVLHRELQEEEIK